MTWQGLGILILFLALVWMLILFAKSKLNKQKTSVFCVALVIFFAVFCMALGKKPLVESSNELRGAEALKTQGFMSSTLSTKDIELAYHDDSANRAVVLNDTEFDLFARDSDGVTYTFKAGGTKTIRPTLKRGPYMLYVSFKGRILKRSFDWEAYHGGYLFVIKGDGRTELTKHN